MRKVFLRCKSRLLDLLFPPQCCGCGKIGAVLCASCADALMRIPPQCFVCHAWVPGTESVPPGRTCKQCRPRSAVYAFLSPFSYQHKTMRELVHGLKYRRNREIASLFADILAAHLAAMRITFPKDTVLIPIPLHKARERERGFNQSLLIAKILGEKLGIEVKRDVLQKIKKTAPQMSLLREERLKNLAGTFAIQNSLPVRGKIMVLVDDVKTTGATLEEAARVLKRSGAKQTWAMTVAH
ncbi:MAG: ComF family protein [Candidatus Sungbacteria bacterium]|nr:ComF family protein [Candidatus Sungbacteria bacterium]